MNISKCKIIDLPKITNEKGDLTFIEENEHIPFEFKRVYYVYDTAKGETRGGHVHKNLHQLIIAISGSFDVVLDDGSEKKSFHLDKPYHGLYVPPLIWHEFNNFTSEAICLVLVSELYRNEDTVSTYETFRKIRLEQKNGE